ncbi:MAG: hypothetical protein LUQ37_07690 [Methanoregulaceae archaeon]|nr:hypothetical protein [Methanoregulaceae archaeon]
MLRLCLRFARQFVVAVVATVTAPGLAAVAVELGACSRIVLAVIDVVLIALAVAVVVAAILVVLVLRAP